MSTGIVYQMSTKSCFETLVSQGFQSSSFFAIIFLSTKCLPI